MPIFKAPIASCGQLSLSTTFSIVVPHTQKCSSRVSSSFVDGQCACSGELGIVMILTVFRHLVPNSVQQLPMPSTSMGPVRRQTLLDMSDSSVLRSWVS